MPNIKNADKALHLIVGAALQIGIVAISSPWLGFNKASALALMSVAFIAWAKEEWDKARPERHTWDGWDAFATLLGGVAAYGWLVNTGFFDGRA